MDDDESRSSFDSSKKKERDYLKKDSCSCSNVLIFSSDP